MYATESYTYQYNNLVSTVTDPGNDIYTYTYDFLDRKTQVQYPDSSTVTCSYDDTNNKVTFTNGRNYDRIYWYDWLSRLEKVEEEYTTDTYAVTTYQYDDVGHLTSVTDAETHTTSYTYASIFGLTKTTYPDSEYEEYKYDNVGNLTSFTDCRGNETTYTYDSIWQLTQIQYQDQSTVDFTYDLNSNRTKMEDNAPHANDYVEYTYDSWNRLTAEKRHISISSYEVTYQYDVASRLIKLTYPDSMQILYSYDDLNRTTKIKRYVDGSNDEVLLDQVQYNADNLITQFDYGNDLRATFSYDARDRISTINVRNNETSYLDLDYTYDNSNNITQLVNGWRDTDFDWNSDSEIYSYDGLNRLTSASCTSWSHTYSYDNVGNRTSRDSITYTINAVNEVTALSNGTFFTYDDNGNRTQKTKDTDTWVYTYDYANRLTRIEKNNTTLGEYVYDGSGKRLQVTENSVTTTYIHSGLSILYEENTNRSATYIYGLTGLIAKRATINGESHTYFYHTDHLGSTRLVTDENKNIVSAITYHPFGEVDIKEGSEDFLFTGKEEDSTGLYYYYARYYDSEIGRFITRDSWTYLPNDLRSFGQAVTQWMSDPQIFNRYSYCRNNPLMYTDPSGHGWLKKIGLAICVSLAAASIFLALCAIVFATGGLAAGPIIWFILSCYAGYECVTAFVMECLSSGRVYTQKIYMHDLDKNVEGDEKVVGVEQFNKEGELIGGWKLGENENGEKGYLVWDEEKGAYVFVSENEWKPPSLAKSGENQEPITIQNHPPLWWVPEPEPSNPLNPFTGMWPQQGNGVQAGTRSYVI